MLLVANKFQTGFDQPLLCGMYIDKRLAGVQAVQTLSRLNRAHPGKDTTYVVDFVNDPSDVLSAFKTYYATAELSATTDPELVYDLRARLDAAGHYDDFEVDRVVAVEMNSRAKQSELIAAPEPVVDRVTKRYKLARAASKSAQEQGDEDAAKAAKAEMDALTLFKGDMGVFLRLYTFLSQIFDFGNTAIEKRSLFYRRLLPLLEFGRERQRAGERETAAERDHREGERALRGKRDRPGQARLRERRHQGKAAGIQDAGTTSGEQHQGAVRQLARPEDRAA